jgi:hypothetical protein
MGKSKWVLLGIAVLALGAAALFYDRFLEVPSIPEETEIKGITARLYNSPTSLPDLPEFEVPAEHVSTILQSLRPARRDPSPMRRQGMGYLRLVRKGGKPAYVQLYWTRDQVGAFSVGLSPRGVYYRGGTDKGIEDALRKAFADSQGGQGASWRSRTGPGI